MKKIRITWNGELLRDVYPHATRWQVFKYRARKFARKVLIVVASTMFLSGMTYTAFAVGIQYAQPKVINIVQSDAAVPVLERIAKCESGSNQFAKDGQVLLHWNKNGTVDVGKYAINVNVWGAQATKLHLDLTKPEDNKAMALWIYHNVGTESWYPSKECWNK